MLSRARKRAPFFLFRESFIDTLWESLEKHSILLLAPRRIGKTSVMLDMLDHPRAGWRVLRINTEKTEPGICDFAGRLLKTWWRKHFGYKSDLG
jgi:hypothetical protein